MKFWIAVACLGVVAACGAAQRPDGGRGLLPPGAPAPDVSGVDQHGARVELRDGRGRPQLVYFYPKDGTPGCTREACAFRDAWSRYEAAGIRILGVSVDDVESHAEFATEQGLPFSLIADESGAWARAFGVPRVLGMTRRVSFLLTPRLTVAKVYSDVDPATHASEVLADAALHGAVHAPAGATP